MGSIPDCPHPLGFKRKKLNIANKLHQECSSAGNKYTVKCLCRWENHNTERWHDLLKGHKRPNAERGMVPGLLVQVSLP